MNKQNKRVQLHAKGHATPRKIAAAVQALCIFMLTAAVVLPTMASADATTVGSAKQRCDEAASNSLTYKDVNTGGTHESNPTGTPSDGKYKYEDVLGNGSVYRGGNAHSYATARSGAYDDTELDTDPNDFAAVLPYGTVYIDVASMSFTSKNTIINIIDTANFTYNDSSSSTPRVTYQKKWC